MINAKDEYRTLVLGLQNEKEFKEICVPYIMCGALNDLTFLRNLNTHDLIKFRKVFYV